MSTLRAALRVVRWALVALVAVLLLAEMAVYLWLLPLTG